MSSSGFLIIDKPAGITSHDVVDRVRRITGERRVGHAGTLDPFATGLLIVGVGREATKRLAEHMGQDKEYVATAILGATSDTQDRTGQIEVSQSEVGSLELGEAKICEAMTSFVGEIEQIPPMYSAKKIAGKKLYELARAGETVERQPVKIKIHEFTLLEFRPTATPANVASHDDDIASTTCLSNQSPASATERLPRVTFRVRCSPGTYVRTLAHDLGQKLGCGAYLEELRRTMSGTHTIAEATPLADLTKENWEAKLVTE